MRWNRLAVIALSTLSSLAVALALTSAAPAAKSARAKLIERGEYLSIVGGCNDCHTPGTMYGDPDFSRRLGGSELGWRGPWGVSYPRNISPDMETGIGKWTEEQIVSTLRTGQRPDGSVMLPPMPWPNTARMSDGDLHALAAYLKSIPPVQHKMPDAVPPGTEATGSILVMPPPSAWDAPKSPPPSGK